MSREQRERLDSWKEIAAYLNRSVRTVRRWEQEEGLPVHRHMHRALGSVYAYGSELDAWLQKSEDAVARTANAPTHGGRPNPSVLVLPFANLSPEPDNEYFVEGLTGDVIAHLSRLRALRVISRTSSMALKTTTKDIKTIGRRSGAAYVVEGTVRRAGQRLRVSAQLIDAESDEHLWAETYDGTLEDVFAIQERLARTIVDALRVTLSPDESRLLSLRPIRNLHAYECYLRARYEALRWREDAITHAVQLLRNGLEIVGENTQLYAALGQTYLQYREAGIDFTDGPLRQAETCADRILALEPHSVAGSQLRGFIHYANGRIQEAVRDLKAAREGDWNDAATLGLLCNCYLIAGRVSVARPLIEQLIAGDPLTPLTRCLPGWADILEGNFAPALAPYRLMYEMDPGNPMARLFLVWVLALNGHTRELQTVVDSFPLSLRDTTAARVAFFLARAYEGERGAAFAVLTPDIEAVANSNDLFPRFLAQGCALAGEPELAVQWLRIAVDRGFINYPFLAQHDPFMKPLRQHPAVVELLATVRQRWENFEA